LQLKQRRKIKSGRKYWAEHARRHQEFSGEFVRVSLVARSPRCGMGVEK
jgi:hypothetical protein